MPYPKDSQPSFDPCAPWRVPKGYSVYDWDDRHKRVAAELRLLGVHITWIIYWAHGDGAEHFATRPKYVADQNGVVDGSDFSQPCSFNQGHHRDIYLHN